MRTRAGSASRRRSRRRTRRRSPPTPSRPTAVSSCSTGRSAPRWASGWRSSSSRCCSHRATTPSRSRRSSRSRACGSSTTRSGERSTPSEWDLKRVMGGRARAGARPRAGPARRDGGRLRRARDGAVWDDLLFAWTVVKHTLSNAIVIARGGQTLGIGAWPDEPGRCRADRGREGARARPLARGRGARLGRVLPVRRRARSSRSRPASARSSSRAARSGTTRSSPRCARRARRWCSPAAATSGTEPVGAVRLEASAGDDHALPTVLMTTGLGSDPRELPFGAIPREGVSG